MSRDDGPDPATWGRRPYADVEAREILNDASRRIARNQPDHVDDPGDPTLSEVLQHTYRQDTDLDTDAWTLTELKAHDLSFGEAVCWWFFRYAGYDLGEIHHAVSGRNFSDDPGHRRNSLRNIQRMLKSAATKLPGESPDDVPDAVGVDRERTAET